MRPQLTERLYLASLSLAVVTLLLLRLFVVPHFETQPTLDLLAITNSILDSLTGAAVASLLVSILLITIIGRQIKEGQEAEVIDAKKVGPLLKDTAARTSLWNYRGHTGQYFRTMILPTLARESSNTGRRITMCVQVLNPDDADLMDYFMAYRTSGPSSRNGTVNRADLEAEILSTILSVAQLAARSPRLDVTLFLSETLSPYTVDISSEVAVLSRAEESALKYAFGSTFYQSAVDDLRLGFRQAHEVSFPANLPREIDSIDKVKSALALLGIVAVISEDALANAVLTKMRTPVSPYRQ